MQPGMMAMLGTTRPLSAPGMRQVGKCLPSVRQPQTWEGP